MNVKFIFRLSCKILDQKSIFIFIKYCIKLFLHENSIKYILLS